MLKTLFRGYKQHQIVCKKQPGDPGASNSDTVVDSAVTVYPIHIDQWFSTFLVPRPIIATHYNPTTHI